MINEQFIASVVEKHPGYTYQLTPKENKYELIIERSNIAKSGIGYGRIRKLIDADEDLSVLDEVLKREGG